MPEVNERCDAVAAAIARWIFARGIPFERGEPVAYFSRVLRMVDRLTVDDVPPARRSTALMCKGLFVLWAIVVDDAMDRHDDRAPLDASTRWLADVERPESGDHAEAILRAAFVRLRRYADETALEVLQVDVWEQIHGLHYEALFGHAPELATTREYSRYSALVMSIKVYVDIDRALANGGMTGAHYRRVRTTCDVLGFAIKLASDIGTLAREIDEGAPNLVALRLRDAGFELRQAVEDDGPARKALREVVRATEVQAWHELANVRRDLHDYDGALTRLVSVAEQIVLEYCAGDPFFDDEQSAEKSGTLFGVARTA